MQVTSWLGAGRAGRHPGVPGVGETLGATRGNSDTQTSTMARPEAAVQMKACLDPGSLLAASWGVHWDPWRPHGVETSPQPVLVNQ